MDNLLLQNYRWLAQYNRWFNTRLYDPCERLDDGQRKLERGAFFSSIHRTLNHLIVADQIWLRRLEQCAMDPAAHRWPQACLTCRADMPWIRCWLTTGRLCIPNANNSIWQSKIGWPAWQSRLRAPRLRTLSLVRVP